MRAIITLTVLLSLFACGNKEHKVSTNGNQITVGVILPSTGKYGVIGEGEMKGINLALDSINQLFGQDYNLNVLYEDTESKSSAVPAIVQNLLNKKVDAIITSTTGSSEIASPLLRNKTIPHFVISPDIEILKRNENNYRIYYNFISEANTLLQYVSDNSISRIALLGSQYTSIQNLIENHLMPKLIEMNVSIVYKDLVSLESRDFKNHFLKIRQSKPELIFLAPMTNQVELFAKSIAESKIDTDSIDVFGSFTFNWKPKTYISTLEGYKIIGSAYSSKDNQFYRAFTNKYKTSPNFDCAYAFDNIMILYDILKETKTSNKNFKEIFNSKNPYKGASGEIIFKGGNDTDPKTRIYHITNGEITSYE